VFGHVRLERDAIPGAAAGLPRHCDRFLGGGEIVVDGEHLGAFLNEPKHGRATVAHALARRLACANHDGDFVLKAHWEPPTVTCRPTPYGKSADDTSTSRCDSFLRVACVKIIDVPEGKASIRRNTAHLSGQVGDEANRLERCARHQCDSAMTRRSKYAPRWGSYSQIAAGQGRCHTTVGRAG